MELLILINLMRQLELDKMRKIFKKNLKYTQQKIHFRMKKMINKQIIDKKKKKIKKVKF
jgi:hypothetical protein